MGRARAAKIEFLQFNQLGFKRVYSTHSVTTVRNGGNEDLYIKWEPCAHVVVCLYFSYKIGIFRIDVMNMNICPLI